MALYMRDQLFVVYISLLPGILLLPLFSCIHGLWTMYILKFSTRPLSPLDIIVLDITLLLLSK